MAINNPAQPSTTNLATTTNESRGGLFTNTNGVGIDLSSVAGPPGTDGRGIADITVMPTDPALGEDVTVTVTYTDSSTPTSFTVAAGEMGIAGTPGASIIPIFFREEFNTDGTLASVGEPSTRLNQEIVSGATEFTPTPVSYTHLTLPTNREV